MTTSNSATHTTIQSWTTQRLIDFSQKKAIALGFSLDSATSQSHRDSWTTAQLISFSKSLAEAYGSGL